MIAVTGMHRSGTSCVTGLLHRCGLSLGTSHPLLNEPRPDNPKGHHENLGALAVNQTLLKHAGGSWYRVPAAEVIRRTGQAISMHIKSFGETFDGDVMKDPRLSLTISSWRRFCPQLELVVFCVRNPIGVALSLQRRDGLPIETGLHLWMQYNIYFLQGIGDCKVVYLNYDTLADNLSSTLARILNVYGKSCRPNDIAQNIDGFFERSLNHDDAGASLLNRLPADYTNLYSFLCKKTEAVEWPRA